MYIQRGILILPTKISETASDTTKQLVKIRRRLFVAKAAHTNAFPKIANAPIRNKNIKEAQREALRGGLEHGYDVEFSVAFVIIGSLSVLRYDHCFRMILHDIWEARGLYTEIQLRMSKVNNSKQLISVEKSSTILMQNKLR